VVWIFEAGQVMRIGNKRRKLTGPAQVNSSWPRSPSTARPSRAIPPSRAGRAQVPCQNSAQTALSDRVESCHPTAARRPRPPAVTIATCPSYPPSVESKIFSLLAIPISVAALLSSAPRCAVRRRRAVQQRHQQPLVHLRGAALWSRCCECPAPPTPSPSPESRAGPLQRCRAPLRCRPPPTVPRAGRPTHDVRLSSDRLCADSRTGPRRPIDRSPASIFGRRAPSRTANHGEPLPTLSPK
jgi:hypothetical protein